MYFNKLKQLEAVGIDFFPKNLKNVTPKCLLIIS